jgi:predicted 2-oxoglutarate/Fe(II)-dependent dioxygenase YbiX
MYYKIIDNVLTTEECDKIIDFGKSLKLEYIKTYKPSTGQNFIDYSFNKRKGIKFENKEFNIIGERILNIINECKIYSGLKYDKLDEVLFNQYNETNFLNYHIDTAEIENGATITVVYQLNDNYDGGEFCYKINDIEYIVPKKKGSIFIFESTILHKVMPITKGCRYSLNNWPKYSKLQKNSLL